MVNWWGYLNYKIYKYYIRKKDSTAFFTAWLASGGLLSLNLLSLVFAIDYIVKTEIINVENYLFFGIIFIFFGPVINYLMIYKGKRYINFFDEFEANRNLYKKWDLPINLYIIITGIFLFTILILFDIRNNDYFN